MPHGNQSESECLLGGKIGKIGKIPGILRVYLEKPGYTRVIPALLHGFAPGTTPTAATTNENPAYHFRIPLYHTTPKLIKISPNTGLIPVNIQHWASIRRRRGTTDTGMPHALSRAAFWLPVDAGGFYGARRGVRILNCERER